MSDPETPERAVSFADLSGDVCPMTFVKAKLLLEQVDPGQLVEIALKEGEQLRDLSMSIKEEGHRIERVERKDGRVHLHVRRNG